MSTSTDNQITDKTVAGARHAETVAVGYAYATSQSAKDNGFYRSGCYTVARMRGQKIIVECGYATKEEAFKVANAINLPFNRYSLQP